MEHQLRPPSLRNAGGSHVLTRPESGRERSDTWPSHLQRGRRAATARGKYGGSSQEGGGVLGLGWRCDGGVLFGGVGRADVLAGASGAVIRPSPRSDGGARSR